MQKKKKTGMLVECMLIPSYMHPSVVIFPKLHSVFKYIKPLLQRA